MFGLRLGLNGLFLLLYLFSGLDSFRRISLGLVWGLASLGFDRDWFRAWSLYASLIGFGSRLGFFRHCFGLFRVGLGIDFFGLFRVGFRLHFFRDCFGIV